jgi:hypothetical protein
MMTLRQFSAEPSTIPTITSWYLADLSKAQGKQELFTHQLPQKLLRGLSDVLGCDLESFRESLRIPEKDKARRNL